MAMFEAFRTLLMRDLDLAMRRRSDMLTTLFFFVIVVTLFPLGIGPELDTLRLIAPGVFWVAALLASMLALERLFAVDFQDGSLEQMLLTPQPLSVLVIAKVVAHWLVTGVPLVLLSPLLGLQYDLSAANPVGINAYPAAGDARAEPDRCNWCGADPGHTRRGVLVSLLVLPLYIPILIFGAGAVEANVSGMGETGHLSMLGAMLLLSLLAAPLATSAALRVSAE